jgi:hypothetical protein
MSDSRKQVIFWVTSVRSSKPATYKLLWQHSVSTVSALTHSPKDVSRYKPHPSNTFKTKDSVPHNHVTMNCSLSRSAENDQKPVTHTSHITWQGIKPGLLHVMTSSNQPGTIRDTSWTQLSRFWEQDMGRTAEWSLSLPKWKPTFSFRQYVDSRSGAHPATYSIGTENPFGGVKRPGHERNHSHLSTAEEYVELYFHSRSRLRGLVFNWTQTRSNFTYQHLQHLDV